VRDFVLGKLTVYTPGEPDAKDLSQITIVGNEGKGGIYLLGIEVSRNLGVVFGRYNQGKPVDVSAGEYVYIGAAHGQRGSTTLGNRVLRHATRSGGRYPHRIRPVLAVQFNKAGLGGILPLEKSPHWHIDYLLDEEAAEIKKAILLRTKARIEIKLAKMVEAMPETFVFAPGLGASDHPGGTHVLRVEALGEWWEKLVEIVKVVR
jgi:Uri superfamily endonuclease